MRVNVKRRTRERRVLTCLWVKRGEREEKGQGKEDAKCSAFEKGEREEKGKGKEDDQCIFKMSSGAT